jgi:hypothetical protein
VRRTIAAPRKPVRGEGKQTRAALLADENAKLKAELEQSKKKAEAPAK